MMITFVQSVGSLINRKETRMKFTKEVPKKWRGIYANVTIYKEEIINNTPKQINKLIDVKLEIVKDNLLESISIFAKK